MNKWGGELEASACVLPDEAIHALTKPVEKQEVYDVLMSMHSHKAPGLDGFQPVFFKMFWEEIGDDFWLFVKNTFDYGMFDPS